MRQFVLISFLLLIFINAFATGKIEIGLPFLGNCSFNTIQLNAFYSPTYILDQIGYKQMIDNLLKEENSLFSYIDYFFENERNALPESNMTTMELITNMGYEAECHYVTTEDKYTLELHRILPVNRTTSKKIPIMLQHGLFGCSSTWVLNFPNQSLGFMLAEAGYDVWLSNIRGNPYGKSHKTFDPKSKQFWDFSFEEVARFDLSSNIDYILNITNNTQINYVGHSMGTTMAFVLLSTQPHYNDKIRTFFGLAPVAYIHHMKSPLVKLLAYMKTTLETIISALKVYWFPPSDGYSSLVDKFCPPNGTFCTDLISLIVGPNAKQTNQSRISVYIHQLTKLTSLRTLLHYGQMFRSTKFRRYDWGFINNWIKYKSLRPPLYKVNSITTPTVFFCGRNDYLSSLEDVQLLVNQLPRHVKTIIAEDPDWNHLDFITSIDDGPEINDYIIQLIDIRENSV